MTKAQTYGTGATVLIIILLLLMGRGNSRTIIEQQAGDINVGGLGPVTIDVPPLNIPMPKGPGDQWDWMTTSLGCMCDTGYQGPAYVPPDPPPARRITPSYVYVQPQTYQPPALAITTPTPIPAPYTPPPAVYQASLPTFSWGWTGIGARVQTNNGVQTMSLARVVYINDPTFPFPLASGLENRPFSMIGDDIVYRGQRFQRVG